MEGGEGREGRGERGGVTVFSALFYPTEFPQTHNT